MSARYLLSPRSRAISYIPLDRGLVGLGSHLNVGELSAGGIHRLKGEQHVDCLFPVRGSG